MVFNNKENEVFHKQKYLNSEESKNNTFTRLNKYMIQTQLEAAVLGVNKPLVSVLSKDGDINHLTTNYNTLLEEVVIFWLYGMYGIINNLNNFIEYINFLINQNARFTDELDIQIQQDISKEVSDFIKPTDNSKYTITAYKKENVVFTSIRNARLEMGKFLESEFCRKNRLFNSHFNINSNKGYAQKNYVTGTRNYVVYRGCIKTRASWSVMLSDKNSSQIVKKESINIYIKDDGTVHLSEQDKLRYKKINFNGCRMLIGGHRLEDVLKKGRWLYSDNQLFCDSGYYSREASPERKTSIFDSNNGNLINPDTCKVNQENNKNSSVKDTDIEQNQLLDSESDSFISSYGSSKFDDVINGILQNLQSINIDENDVAEIEEKNRKVEEENKMYFKKSNSNKFYAKLSKGKRCTYEQQTTIACGISIDNSQMSLKYSDQNGNVIKSNVGDSISDQYCEDMDMDKKTLAAIDNHTVTLPEKVSLLLNGRSYFHGNDITVFDAMSNSQEPDRSSANGLSWDNNTLDLNDVELDHNPPCRAQSFNSKHRSSSVPTR